MATLNEELRDREIQRALLNAGAGRGLADKLLKLLNSADKEIADKLAAILVAIEERGTEITAATWARLDKAFEPIADLNTVIYGKVGDVLATELTALAQQEADFQVGTLEKGLRGAPVAVSPPSKNLIRAIVEERPMEGYLLKDWVAGMAKGRIDRIGQAVRKGMEEGKSTDDIVRLIRGTKAAGYADGILDISRRSAQSIVRTAVTHVSNVAAQHTWKANAHVVKAWQFIATLDSRTTVTCAGLSGQTFPIGEGPIPPRHIRCRSISVAVTKSFREMGIDADELPPSKRASIDGQVAGDVTFSNWLKSKGDDTQDQVLGKTRADLFRSGKLDLQQFIKNDGTVLTLAELKKCHGDLLA